MLLSATHTRNKGPRATVLRETGRGQSTALGEEGRIMALLYARGPNPWRGAEESPRPGPVRLPGAVWHGSLDARPTVT